MFVYVTIGYQYLKSVDFDQRMQGLSERRFLTCRKSRIGTRSVQRGDAERYLPSPQLSFASAAVDVDSPATGLLVSVGKPCCTNASSHISESLCRILKRASNWTRSMSKNGRKNGTLGVNVLTTMSSGMTYFNEKVRFFWIITTLILRRYIGNVWRKRSLNCAEGMRSCVSNHRQTYFVFCWESELQPQTTPKKIDMKVILSLS